MSTKQAKSSPVKIKKGTTPKSSPAKIKKGVAPRSGPVKIKTESIAKPSPAKVKKEPRAIKVKPKAPSTPPVTKGVKRAREEEPEVKKEVKSPKRPSKKEFKEEAEQEMPPEVKTPVRTFKKEKHEYHPVNVDKTPRNKTNLKSIDTPKGKMYEVNNAATEEQKLKLYNELMNLMEENGGRLRVGNVENGAIHHNLDMGWLVDMPKPNELQSLVFQFNGDDGTTVTGIEGPGKILHIIRATMGREKVTIGQNGKEKRSKGKGWKDLYIEIPNKDPKLTVWKPMEAVIPFRYRPKSIPVGGPKRGKGKKNEIDEDTFKTVFNQNSKFRELVRQVQDLFEESEADVEVEEGDSDGDAEVESEGEDE